MITNSHQHMRGFNHEVKYKIISLTFIFLCLSGCTKEKLDVLRCESERDALVCNNQCVIDTQIKYQIKVNETKGVVMIIVSHEGQQSARVTFDNCQIIDSNNWKCQKNLNSSMANGIFSASNVCAK